PLDVSEQAVKGGIVERLPGAPITGQDSAAKGRFCPHLLGHRVSRAKERRTQRTLLSQNREILRKKSHDHATAVDRPQSSSRAARHVLQIGPRSRVVFRKTQSRGV